jgi:hypothetical protein
LSHAFKEDLVTKGQLIAIGLLAASATLATAEESSKTDPGSGKSCVEYIAAESTNVGLVRMHYRNICATPFDIRIMAEKPRKASIKAGTPEKPAKAYVTCRSDDHCETAEWKIE